MNQPTFSHKSVTPIAPTSQENPLLAVGFRNIDAASDAERARHSDCLRFIQNCAEFEKVRRVAYAALALESAEQKVLEIGCGLGRESTRLAATLSDLPGNPALGAVLGVDLSAKLVADAKARYDGFEKRPAVAATFAACDVAKLSTLPLPHKAYDRCFEERTLQHVPKSDFQAAISEMAKSLTPGGKMVCVEPNWELFFIRSEDSENQAISRQFRSFWCDKFNHGHVAGNLESAMKNAGLKEVNLQQVPVEYRDYRSAELVYDIERSAVSMGTSIISERQAENWINHLRDLDAKGAFYCVLTMWVVSGKKED